MVCIAAFIILAIVGVFVAIISIFKRDLWKAYTRALKKAWGCLWKKVRLQKCETGFKDDVKNTLLSRVIIKHPKWLKPLSIIIEVLSVAIVVVVVWAILTAIKSLLALWVLGTCNVSHPAACTLSSEMCSTTEESEPSNPIEATGRWFTEWGEIFAAIPDKFKTYDANDYNFSYIVANINETEGLPVALDIFDPGCSACLKSYNNQKEAGFFDSYNVRLVPVAIPAKFENSELVVRYMFAAEQMKSGLSLGIIDRIFTGKNHQGISYQKLFNNTEEDDTGELYDSERVKTKIESWLKEDGADDGVIKEIRKIADYPETATKLEENLDILENQLHAKGIPTIIYNGIRHTGEWKNS